MILRVMMKDTEKPKGRRSKVQPSAVVGCGGDAFSELSEFERKTMSIVSAESKSRSRRSMSVDDPGALKEQNGILTEERDKLRVDLEKAAKDLSGARSEVRELKEKLSTAEQNLETNRARNVELKEDLESKKESIRKLMDEKDRLGERVKSLESGRPDLLAQYNEKTFAELDQQVRTLRKERNDLDGKIRTLEERNARLTDERDAFKDDAERLGGELKALKEQIAVERETVTVTRKDEVSMSSSRFEDGNYDVRLGADMSYMTFRKDPDGKALCWANRIFLPKLKAYVPFEKKTKYAGEEIDGMIRIQLVRRGRRLSSRYAELGLAVGRISRGPLLLEDPLRDVVGDPVHLIVAIHLPSFPDRGDGILRGHAHLAEDVLQFDGRVHVAVLPFLFGEVGSVETLVQALRGGFFDAHVGEPLLPFRLSVRVHPSQNAVHDILEETVHVVAFDEGVVAHPSHIVRVHSLHRLPLESEPHQISPGTAVLVAGDPQIVFYDPVCDEILRRIRSEIAEAVALPEILQFGEDNLGIIIRVDQFAQIEPSVSLIRIRVLSLSQGRAPPSVEFGLFGVHGAP